MKAKKILIVTNTYDIHADLLTEILDNKQQAYFRINLDCFPRDYQVTHLFKSGESHGKILNLVSGQEIEIADIGAAWIRKPAEFTFNNNDLSVQEAAFAKQEAEQTLFGLIYSTDCYWLNHPINMRGAMWKPEQLHRAKKMGFSIPDTLVTNSPQAVYDFKQHINNELIYKTLSSPTLAAEDVNSDDVIASSLPTTVISDEELAASSEAVAEVPCQFQVLIEKEYELRVTIIGDQVFAARINSQEDAKTLVDCRDMSATITYQAIELPEHIKLRCLEFMASYQLNYSAIDIIVTKTNEYVFLENNPNGQFLYIEQLIPEFNLLETLAELLIKEAKC